MTWITITSRHHRVNEWSQKAMAKESLGAIESHTILQNPRGPQNVIQCHIIHEGPPQNVILCHIIHEGAEVIQCYRIHRKSYYTRKCMDTRKSFYARESMRAIKCHRMPPNSRGLPQNVILCHMIHGGPQVIQCYIIHGRPQNVILCDAMPYWPLNEPWTNSM